MLAAGNGTRRPPHGAALRHQAATTSSPSSRVVLSAPRRRRRRGRDIVTAAPHDDPYFGVDPAALASMSLDGGDGADGGTCRFECDTGERGLVHSATVFFSDSAALRLRRRALLAWGRTPPRRALLVKKPGIPAASAKLGEIAAWLAARGVEAYVEPAVAAKEFPHLKVWRSPRLGGGRGGVGTLLAANGSGSQTDSGDASGLESSVDELVGPFSGGGNGGGGNGIADASPPSTSSSSSPSSPPFDFVVSLGGDGTVLHLAALFEGDAPLPPIVPFSMGSLGFLTPFDAADSAAVLSRVLAANAQPLYCTLRSRKRCEVLAPVGDDDGGGGGGGMRVVAVHHVLNEVVIDRCVWWCLMCV